MPRLSLLLCTLCFTVPFVAAQYESNACEVKVYAMHANNTLTYDDYWHGPIRGMHSYEHHTSDPITLSYQGCKKVCGTKPRYNDILTGFAILTTWVLPVIALISNLPFENAHPRDLPTPKPRRRRWIPLVPRTSFFEPYVTWMGSPQSAITSIMSNVLLQLSCAGVVRLGIRTAHTRDVEGNGNGAVVRDVGFVVCCLGQYELLEERERGARGARDRAIVGGLVCALGGEVSPLSKANIQREEVKHGERVDSAIEEQSDDGGARLHARLEGLLVVLAHQLRLLRRRGVYPLTISTGWFLVAFVVGLYSCFRALGDYTTAHSLGVGMLLSWLPVLVLMSIADRNPNGIERCRDLIERWLYNVNAVIDAELTGTEPQWWEHTSIIRFRFGHYIGQGRYLQHCGLGDFLLQYISRIGDDSFGSIPDIYHASRARPRRWWLAWASGQFIVTVAVAAAFVIAFNTPTVGLGCRSFLYLMVWCLSTTPWVLQGLFKTIPEWVRTISLTINTISACLFGFLLVVQTSGILNTCFCQSSIFGSAKLGASGGWGGYVQFGDSSFYEKAYSPQCYWYPASAIALSSCVFFLGWTVVAWRRTRVLWDEHWEDGSAEGPGRYDVSLEWLT